MMEHDLKKQIKMNRLDICKVLYHYTLLFKKEVRKLDLYMT